MKMLPALAVAFGIGSILIFYSAIGLWGVFDGGAGENEPIAGEVNETVEEANNTDVDPQENTGFFSFVGSVLGSLTTLVSVLTSTPRVLQNIGFPAAFAELLGRGLQVVLVIGLLQVAIRWEVR